MGVVRSRGELDGGGRGGEVVGDAAGQGLGHDVEELRTAGGAQEKEDAVAPAFFGAGGHLILAALEREDREAGDGFSRGGGDAFAEAFGRGGGDLAEDGPRGVGALAELGDGEDDARAEEAVEGFELVPAKLGGDRGPPVAERLVGLPGIEEAGGVGEEPEELGGGGRGAGLGEGVDDDDHLGAAGDAGERAVQRLGLRNSDGAAAEHGGEEHEERDEKSAAHHHPRVPAGAPAALTWGGGSLRISG
jgi:hypothetical protein